MVYPISRFAAASPVVADAAYGAVRVQIWSRLAGGGTLLGGAAGQLSDEEQVLLGDQIWLTEVTYQLAVGKKRVGNLKGRFCVRTRGIDGAFLPFQQGRPDELHGIVHVVRSTHGKAGRPDGLLQQTQNVRGTGGVPFHPFNAPKGEEDQIWKLFFYPPHWAFNLFSIPDRLNLINMYLQSAV